VGHLPIDFPDTYGFQARSAQKSMDSYLSVICMETTASQLFSGYLSVHSMCQVTYQELRYVHDTKPFGKPDEAHCIMESWKP